MACSGRVVPTKKTGKEFAAMAAAFIPAQQSSNHVLMVAPTAFVKNIQAAEDNHFMHDLDEANGDGEGLLYSFFPHQTFSHLH